MGAEVPLVTFSVDGQRYGLPITSVARVVRAVELTDLPGAPAAIRGVFSWHGTIVPTGDLRRRFGRPARDIEPSDQIIITGTKARPLALLTEGSTAVATVPKDGIVAADAVATKVDAISAVAHAPDGLVLIHDLDKFLSPDEDAALSEALNVRP